jgi:hypothetical protein
MSKVEINILMGLPGSGKSTWRIKNEPTESRRMYVSSFCCDDYMWNDNYEYNYGRYKTIPDIVKRYLDINNNSNFICIDGLFTTNAQIQEVIDVVHTRLPKFRNDEDFVIVIHHWKEDREACLFNDKYRRELSSETSIKNLPLEDPKNYEFDSILKIKIVYHDVVRKTVYEGVFEPLSAFNKFDGILTSNSWTTGGTWGNCWGDKGECEPEPQPEFEEFDRLIERVAPNITFMKYKRLYSECVEILNDYECDYYGGRRTTARYRCDLKKLYDMMEEMNLIEAEQ